MRALRLLLRLLLCAPGLAGKPKRPPPVAVEARFKARITAKLRASLSAAAGHLAWVLLPERGAEGFGRYELELEGAGRWRRSCEADVDAERDSVRLCALHKLQALTALCSVPGAAGEHRAGVRALLASLLGRRDRAVAGLGVKRSLLPVASGLEGWFYETAPGSGQYDIDVALQAAAVLALVQCAGALGDRDLAADAQSWFRAVEAVYPQKLWGKLTFHANSILWESFVLTRAAVHRGSSFAEDIGRFLAGFEAHLLGMLDEDPKAWSFSGAHAAVLSWQGERRAQRRERLGKAVDEYLARWIALAPGLNVSDSYTCGPLQGIAPLLARRGSDAAELVSSTLRLAEKDVDLFQVRLAGAAAAAASPAAARLGGELLAAQGAALEGAFLRDEAQLLRERRRSLRVDDTAQCVLSLVRTLLLLEDLVGVEVPEAAAGSAPGGGAVGAGSAQPAAGSRGTPEGEL